MTDVPFEKPLSDHCRSAPSRGLTPIDVEELCCQHFLVAWPGHVVMENYQAFCSHSDDLAKGGGTQLPPTPHGHDDQKVRSWTESDER